MSTKTWTGAVSTDWADPDNWSPVGVPSASSDVTIAIRRAVASASIGTVNSITDSSDLRFRSAGTNRVTTFLDNSGEMRVDRKGGAGGTILNVGGTLTNSGSLRVGNATLSAPDTVTAASLDNTGEIRLLGSSAKQALLNVTGSAGFGTAGVLSGTVRLTNDSAIEFKSGEITSLAARAILRLNGNDAFIEDSTALGKNSALTGLASIGAGAIFGIHNKAAVSTSGSLANDGTIRLDIVGGDGGSSLTLAGALINSHDLVIGNATLSASDKVTAASLDNKGSINLLGSGADQALLDVTGSAGFGTAKTLTGSVGLSGDSAIEFAGGQITSLAGSLVLNGSDAFIEDSTAPGSNSALAGLASIGATFELANGASVSTTGALVNNRVIEIDPNRGDSGSSLTVGGTLTNANAGTLDVGNGSLSARSLDNTGYIEMTGSGVLDVTAGTAGFGTAGTLTGVVNLSQGAIEFLGGQISTIAAGSEFALDENDAFVEDSTALGSNSALTGLADVAGTLRLFDGASMSTTGSVTIASSGFIDLEQGGSTLSIGGTLTNSGGLQIINSSVTAKSFINSGTVELGGNLVALKVSGATTNSRSISNFSATEEFAGAVGGAGSFSLEAHANLRFDSSVSARQTINAVDQQGPNALILEQAQSFAATISGFGTGDTIDAANFHAPPATTYNFVENSGGTGGTLTLTDAAAHLTANILMTGDYSNKSFTLASDSGTGTLVKFV